MRPPVEAWRGPRVLATTGEVAGGRIAAAVAPDLAHVAWIERSGAGMRVVADGAPGPEVRCVASNRLRFVRGEVVYASDDRVFVGSRARAGPPLPRSTSTTSRSRGTAPPRCGANPGGS